MSSWPSSIAPRPSPIGPWPSSMPPRPSSMASGLTTASRSSLMAPHISNSTHNLHQGPPIPFPRQRPFPHPFANPIPQPSTRFSSKEQHVHHSITSFPISFLSATQKQLSKVQPRCFGPLLVSPFTTLPFQRPPPDFHLTYPPSELCQDEQ